MKDKFITKSKRYLPETEVKWMNLVTTDVGSIVEKPTRQNKEETGKFVCTGMHSFIQD